ncbi:hypothetical protein BOX15_Mlig017266g1, partial [Macrostomum lignano]
TVDCKQTLIEMSSSDKSQPASWADLSAYISNCRRLESMPANLQASIDELKSIDALLGKAAAVFDEGLQLSLDAAATYYSSAATVKQGIVSEAHKN